MRAYSAAAKCPILTLLSPGMFCTHTGTSKWPRAVQQLSFWTEMDGKLVHFDMKQFFYGVIHITVWLSRSNVQLNRKGQMRNSSPTNKFTYTNTISIIRSFSPAVPLSFVQP